jgi:hypothetical protein
MQETGSDESGAEGERSPHVAAVVPAAPDQGAGETPAVDSKKSDDQSLFTSFVGQAAAAITLAGVLIYGSGGLTLALRLAFSRLPWESVLGQLPHDLLLTTGFGQVILPATITGLLGTVLLDFLVNGEQNDNGLTASLRSGLRAYLSDPPGWKHFGWWALVSIVAGAAEAGIFVCCYIYHESGFRYYGVVVAWWQAFIYVLIISSLAVGMAIIFLPPPPADAQCVVLKSMAGKDTSEETVAIADREMKRRGQFTRTGWKVLVGLLVTFAAIPLWSSISASTLFPFTVACSSGFTKSGLHTGNLIGTNGNWIYMAEYRERTEHRTQNGKQISVTTYFGPYLSVVPLSSVQLLATGTNVTGECSIWLTKP